MLGSDEILILQGLKRACRMLYLATLGDQTVDGEAPWTNRNAQIIYERGLNDGWRKALDAVQAAIDTELDDGKPDARDSKVEVPSDTK